MGNRFAGGTRPLLASSSVGFLFLFEGYQKGPNLAGRAKMGLIGGLLLGTLLARKFETYGFRNLNQCGRFRKFC
jgi:hypothetical protein